MKIITICIISIISVVGLLALSYGPVMSRANPTERIRIMSDLRTLSTGLLSFYAKNDGKYPDNLQQLVEQKLITPDMLSPDSYTLHYVTNLTAIKGDHIILYTSEFESKFESDKGTVICSRVNGRSEKINKEELEKQLKEQLIERQLSKQNSPTQD